LLGKSLLSFPLIPALIPLSTYPLEQRVFDSHDSESVCLSPPWQKKQEMLTLCRYLLQAEVATRLTVGAFVCVWLSEQVSTALPCLILVLLGGSFRIPLKKKNTNAFHCLEELQCFILL
jgi:hypothetical protein